MTVEELRQKVDDFHTHVPRTPRAIINTRPGEKRAPGFLYSAGIHPWNSAICTESDFKALLVDANRREVVAIGECGIDHLRGPEIEIQQDVFVRQAEIAEKAGKPLLIHCVRAYDKILELHKRLRPQRSQWIIHGFRGKPELARQLTCAGIYLSLGERFNPKVPESVDPRFIVRETDAMPSVDYGE